MLKFSISIFAIFQPTLAGKSRKESWKLARQESGCNTCFQSIPLESGRANVEVVLESFHNELAVALASLMKMFQENSPCLFIAS